ncbi:MAG TPA: hypothetical protein VMR31_01120 [Myxococcota bacterium]|nr:hypothetical protein [Myxococcota bacterium]
MAAKVRVLCALLAGVAAVARASDADESALSVAKLYPYLVTDAYLERGGRELSKALGHGVSIALVFDLGQVVQSATSDNLRTLRLSVGQAHQVALENLQRLVRANEVKMMVLPTGPDSRPFVLVGGHWAAATAILLPNLLHMVAAPLGTQDVCASIPHREAMLIFACGDRAYRDQMRALVREKESDGAKPLTYGLFRVGGHSVVPLVE